MVGHSMSSLALFGDVGAASLKEQETSRTLGRKTFSGIFSTQQIWETLPRLSIFFAGTTSMLVRAEVKGKCK